MDRQRSGRIMTAGEEGQRQDPLRRTPSRVLGDGDDLAVLVRAGCLVWPWIRRVADVQACSRPQRLHLAVLEIASTEVVGARKSDSASVRPARPSCRGSLPRRAARRGHRVGPTLTESRACSPGSLHRIASEVPCDQHVVGTDAVVARGHTLASSADQAQDRDSRISLEALSPIDELTSESVDRSGSR